MVRNDSLESPVQTAGVRVDQDCVETADAKVTKCQRACPDTLTDADEPKGDLCERVIFVRDTGK